MNFKRLAFCTVLLSVFAVGRAQAAPAEPQTEPQITRYNFVALYWSVAPSADENRRFDYEFGKDSVALLPVQISGGYGGFAGGFGPYNPPIVRPLSTNQFEALLKELQLADMPALARQNVAPLKSQESLTLTLSDENDADQTFALAYSDEKRPAAYRKLSDYLTALVNSKGLAMPKLATPATS